MSKVVRPKLVPKLRFPEFQGAPEWYKEPLGTLASITLERVGDKKCTPMSITSGVGLISQEEKFGRTIAGNSYKNYVVLKHGDFAYNKSATKDFPQGYIARFTGNDPAAVPNSIFTCIRIDFEQLDGKYLNYMFSVNLHGKWLRQLLTVGARAHGSLNINDDDILGIPVPLPGGNTSLGEQQKIAECLDSLDALIGFEKERLVALKAFKKGLMQRLFLREGERVPRLRFPEFRGSGEWDIELLRKISENLDNRRIPITESIRAPGLIPYYGASGVVDYVKDHLFDEALLCVSEDGANLVARTYPIAFPISGKTWVNNHAHILRFENPFTQKIVEEFLNAIDLGDYLTGMAQPKLNKAMLDKIPIPLPGTEEQKCLASFLFSLDEIISNQSNHLESLLAHKQALMQKLFPPQEAEL